MPIQNSLTIEFTSLSADDTRTLGLKIGRSIHAGTIIFLYGDLGSGKTAFVQGLAKGLDVPEDYYITSPTYTLLNEYPGRLDLHHFDFYRLENPADIDSTGFYEKLDTGGVIAVEWADRLSDDLFTDHIRITIVIQDDDARSIQITAVGSEMIQWVKKL